MMGEFWSFASAELLEFTPGSPAERNKLKLGLQRRSPHRPAAVVVPLLRAAVDVHGPDVFPDDRAVEKSDIAAGGADGGGGRAACGCVRRINSFEDQPVPAVRREG